MRFDQLTIKAQEAVQEAQRDARARGNAELTGDHLLLALLKQDDGVVVPVLQKLGANPETLSPARSRPSSTAGPRSRAPRPTRCSRAT